MISSKNLYGAGMGFLLGLGTRQDAHIIIKLLNVFDDAPQVDF